MSLIISVYHSTEQPQFIRIFWISKLLWRYSIFNRYGCLVPVKRMFSLTYWPSTNITVLTVKQAGFLIHTCAYLVPSKLRYSCLVQGLEEQVPVGNCWGSPAVSLTTVLPTSDPISTGAHGSGILVISKSSYAQLPAQPCHIWYTVLITGLLAAVTMKIYYVGGRDRIVVFFS